MSITPRRPRHSSAESFPHRLRLDLAEKPSRHKVLGLNIRLVDGQRGGVGGRLSGGVGRVVGGGRGHHRVLHAQERLQRSDLRFVAAVCHSAASTRKLEGSHPAAVLLLLICE